MSLTPIGSIDKVQKGLRHWGHTSMQLPPIPWLSSQDASPTTPTTDDWQAWLAAHFAGYVRAPMADRHTRVWQWFAGLTPGMRPRARVEIWSRGGAKSSTAELGTCYVGCRLVRHFALYVCKTQAQADKHLQSIGELFETLGIGRAVNRYNQSKGWTQQILRTDIGFNVVSLGLDAASRGVKLSQYRPDLIVLDDIDDKHDSEDLIAKKIETLTESVLPTGSPDCAVLFVQNKIHKDSIAAQLADGRADFLLDREKVVEEPAVIGLTYERTIADDGTARYRITGGTPTWVGQDLAVCEDQMNTWGRRAFQREAQHEVKGVENGLWKRERDIEPFRVTEVPDLVRIVVGVDPSATSGGDEAGIVPVGVAANGHGYILVDASLQGSPLVWARAAVAQYNMLRADALVAESNNGGEMVAVTIGTVPGAPVVRLIHASRGKLTRAEPVQKLCEEGRLHFVGYLPDLEDECCSYVPGDDSPNRMDALVWAATECLLNARETFMFSYLRNDHVRTPNNLSRPRR